MQKVLRVTSGILLVALLVACGSDNDDETVERIERTPDLLIQEETPPEPTQEVTIEPTEDTTPEATEEATNPQEVLITVPEAQVAVGQVISIYSCPAFTCNIIRDLKAGEQFQFTSPEPDGWFKITLVTDGSIGYLPIAADRPTTDNANVASSTTPFINNPNPIFVPNGQPGGTTYTYVPPPVNNNPGGNFIQPPTNNNTGGNPVQPPSGNLPPVIPGGGSVNNPSNPNTGQPVIPNDIPPDAIPSGGNPPPPADDPTDDLPPGLPSAENPLTNPNSGGGNDTPPPTSGDVATPEPVSPANAAPPTGGGGQIVINPFDPMSAPPPGGGQTGGGQTVDPMSAPPPPIGQ